jgi:hypothetical protein
MAFECSLDPKCSKFIQNRLALKIDKTELHAFFDKILNQNSNYDFADLVKD